MYHFVAPCGGHTFQPIPSPTLVIQKSNNHRKHGEDLPDYPFLLLGKASGSLMPKLAHPNFSTFSDSAQTKGLKVAYYLPNL